jgi:DNA-binding LacI/PurR family transcriptional regulator
MKTKRPTVRDVAREAGVSYQTVSRVINDSSHVTSETRTRVLKAIETLGFRPNRAAQILQTERSHTLEVVMPYNGFNRVLYNMPYVARQLGYHLVISAVNPDEFAETLRSGTSRFVDGFILLPLFPIIDDYDELLALSDGIPFVQIGARSGAYLPSVICDQAQGAKVAAQHLIDLGHRQLAEISGPLRSYDAYDRHEGWLSALKDNNIPSHISAEGEFTIDSGYQAMCQLLDGSTPFTAVFIANDSMTLGAYTALRARGLRVPEDISIVGFDDIPESAHILNGLTTVHQDFEMLGNLALEYLVGIIDNPDTPVYQRVLVPKLVIRGTTLPIR